MDIKKIKPGMILYTMFDIYEDLDGFYDPPINIGKISIWVKAIEERGWPEAWGLKGPMVLAHGGMLYRPESLTDQKPDSYNHYGEMIKKSASEGDD